MNTLHFHSGKKKEVNQLLYQYHYKGFTKNWAMWQVVGSWHLDGGLFGDYGECVAGCVFRHPVAPWLNANSMLELARLVRNDQCDQPLTKLISQTVKIIKKFYPHIHLLISYADGNEKHFGGIYQAASWYYDGPRKCTNAMIQFDDGRMIHSRQVGRLFGTNDSKKLTKMGVKCKPVPSIKQLYWKPLNKKGELLAEQMDFKKNPYFKPDHKK